MYIATHLEVDSSRNNSLSLLRYNIALMANIKSGAHKSTIKPPLINIKSIANNRTGLDVLCMSD